MLTIAFVTAHILDAGNFLVGVTGLNWQAFLTTLPLSIAIFFYSGVYRSLVRFTSANTLAQLLIAYGISTIVLWTVSAFLGSSLTWVVAFNFFLIGSGGAICGRFIARSYFRSQAMQDRVPVAIYGANDLGRQLLTSLQQGVEYRPVVMLDNSDDLIGTTIGGVGVQSPKNLNDLISKLGVKIVFIAMSEVSRQTQKELNSILKSTPVVIQSIPGINDILSGRAKITDFQDFKIEELLGREPVAADANLLEATTSGKSVLVSGAGGSIGSEISRQVLGSTPKKLILVDNSEFALYSLEQELLKTIVETGKAVEIIPVLGDVCDLPLIEERLRSHQVDTVFHTAAYKHVPMLEDNTIAAIRNNAFGTMEIVKASINAGVSRFIMVSTDKAVRPTNVMGATKRLAELICQAYADKQDRTKISMVRFGNVLGSSGSVIPTFRNQISRGGPVNVTHKDITRYFMTIPEASQLVIQSSAMATGGDVFLLDMGEPIKIVDLARTMIRLSGYTPVVSSESQVEIPLNADEIAIEFTGLRPGEKLYEELLIDANAEPTPHPLIKKAHERKLKLHQLEDDIEALRLSVENLDPAQALSILKRLPLEYVNS